MADEAQRPLPLKPTTPVGAVVPEARQPWENIKPGVWVEWHSPLFHPQRAEVIGMYTNEVLEVWHPLAQTLCQIPRAWVTRVWTQPAGGLSGH